MSWERFQSQTLKQLIFSHRLSSPPPHGWIRAHSRGVKFPPSRVAGIVGFSFRCTERKGGVGGATVNLWGERRDVKLPSEEVKLRLQSRRGGRGGGRDKERFNRVKTQSEEKSFCPQRSSWSDLHRMESSSKLVVFHDKPTTCIHIQQSRVQIAAGFPDCKLHGVPSIKVPPHISTWYDLNTLFSDTAHCSGLICCCFKGLFLR